MQNRGQKMCRFHSSKEKISSNKNKYKDKPSNVYIIANRIKQAQFFHLMYVKNWQGLLLFSKICLLEDFFLEHYFRVEQNDRNAQYIPLSYTLPKYYLWRWWCKEGLESLKVIVILTKFIPFCIRASKLGGNFQNFNSFKLLRQGPQILSNPLDLVIHFSALEHHNLVEPSREFILSNLLLHLKGPQISSGLEILQFLLCQNLTETY